MKTKNTHTSRELWLQAATDELRPYFEKLGYSYHCKMGQDWITYLSHSPRSRGACL